MKWVASNEVSLVNRKKVTGASENLGFRMQEHLYLENYILLNTINGGSLGFVIAFSRGRRDTP